VEGGRAEKEGERREGRGAEPEEEKKGRRGGREGGRWERVKKKWEGEDGMVVAWEERVEEGKAGVDAGERHGRGGKRKSGVRDGKASVAQDSAAG